MRLWRPWSRRPATERRRFSPVGRRPIRGRSRGSRSTGETTTPSCSCVTSRRRFTESSRSVPRCSTHCPAQGHPPGRRASRVSGAHWPHASDPLVLAFDDLHAVSNPSCLDVLAELSRYVPAGSQIADHEQARAAPAPRPLASAGLGDRDRPGRPPAGRAGGEAAPRGRGRRARRRRALRADRAHGGLAGRPVPGSAVDAGRGGRPRCAPTGLPAATASCPSTSTTSFCPGCRKPR